MEAVLDRNVYRAVEDVCDFGLIQKGVKPVVGRNDESAGVVHKRDTGDKCVENISAI